jgi:hypothetical protein
VISERARHSARIYNIFLYRASEASLAVGLAITTASIVTMQKTLNQADVWVWCAIGIALITSSLVIPVFSVLEE